jgi:hypothetical protein
VRGRDGIVAVALGIVALAIVFAGSVVMRA